MFKQRCLVFLESERWETLWAQFPEQARREVTQQCARLMARALIERIRALRTKRETDDEPRHS
jgi:uncharacterized protein (DUF1697 family)